MFKFFKDALNDSDEMLTSFYGMVVPSDPKYKKKLATALQTLGDKYLLAKSQPRVQQ